eukprot:UN00567
MNAASYERELAPPHVLNAANQRWSKEDMEFNNAIMKCMTDVDNSFRDNFDYPTGMTAIFDLLRVVNKYMAAREPKILLLRKAREP